MKTDLEIARESKPRPVISIAKELGIPERYLEVYGKFKAKVSLEILKAKRPSHKSKYVVVTGITPTHLGEGKTVTTIGLSMALNRIGKRSVSCIRQPSIGPFFGIKGGGVGGGYSQVLPMDDINLHLTGDIHAVGQAHNLSASFLDNHLFRGNKLNIDINKIFWRRVVDVNDRALRNVRIGLGGGEYSVERDTGFDITAASEIMAILALTGSVQDLREDRPDSGGLIEEREAGNLRRPEGSRLDGCTFEGRDKTEPYRHIRRHAMFYPYRPFCQHHARQ